MIDNLDLWMGFRTPTPPHLAWRGEPVVDVPVAEIVVPIQVDVAAFEQRLAEIEKLIAGMGNRIVRLEKDQERVLLENGHLRNRLRLADEQMAKFRGKNPFGHAPQAPDGGRGYQTIGEVVKGMMPEGGQDSTPPAIDDTVPEEMIIQYTEQATRPRDNFSDWLKIGPEGYHDLGANHRMITIASEIQKLGLWSPGVELWIHDPYVISQRLGLEGVNAIAISRDNDGFHVRQKKVRNYGQKELSVVESGSEGQQTIIMPGSAEDRQARGIEKPKTKGDIDVEEMADSLAEQRREAANKEIRDLITGCKPDEVIGAMTSRGVAMVLGAKTS